MRFCCVPGTRSLGRPPPLRDPWRALGKGCVGLWTVGCLALRWAPRAVGGSAVGKLCRPILRTGTRAPLRKIVLGPGSPCHELWQLRRFRGSSLAAPRSLLLSRHSPWARRAGLSNLQAGSHPGSSYRDEPKGLGEPGSLGLPLSVTPTHFPTGRPRPPGMSCCTRPPAASTTKMSPLTSSATSSEVGVAGAGWGSRCRGEWGGGEEGRCGASLRL